MAYYLTVEKKKGEYTPLDITTTPCFYRTSNLKNMGATLQEIDLFTMNFTDEHELRTFLFRSYLLDFKSMNKKLSIRNLRNNRLHKVMYDFLYQDDIDYICDPEKLIARINDKLCAGDFRFVEKFANNFLEFHDCLSTAPEVREFAQASQREQYCSRHFYEQDEHEDNPLQRMARLLIYDYYQEKNGHIVYKSTIKYRNLHNVLAFVDYYDNKYVPKDNITAAKSKKKKKYIPGQTSLFE